MLKYKYMFLELVTSLFERSISKGQLCGCWIDGKIPLQKKAVRVLRAVCNGPHLSSRRSASFVLLFPIFYIRLWMHVLSTVHDAFSTRTRGKGYLGFRNAIRGIVVVCIVYLAVVEDFVCHRGKWLVFANCFLVDSWCWRETDDEVFEQSRNWEIHRIRVSLFVFSILAGHRRKVKGFPTRLSVKIRDRIVGVFDMERTGGKTLKGKKKEKMRSKPDECMRMCVIVGKSDWTRVHARKDHERETWTYGTTLTGPTLQCRSPFLYIIHRLHSTCVYLLLLRTSLFDQSIIFNSFHYN